MTCTLCDNEPLEAMSEGILGRLRKILFCEDSKSVIKNVCLGEKYFVGFIWDLQVMLGIRGIIARAAADVTDKSIIKRQSNGLLSPFEVGFNYCLVGAYFSAVRCTVDSA